MKLKSNQPKATAEQVVKDIRRATDEVGACELTARLLSNILFGAWPLFSDLRGFTN
jgi:hypothetical protein